MDNTLLYGFYILIWPAITLGVLVLICTATYRDIKKAKRNNKDIV
ncbi:putative transporter small subunit [uncultured Psychrobacter sp.]